MGDACRALGTPVTGGNVSLYNESPAGAVYPTPVIGMIGVLEDVAHAVGSHFRHAGDAVVLLGEPTDEIGASEYLLTIHGVVAGAPPACDLERERALIETLLSAITAGNVRSAHDVSEGGLAVSLAECAIGDAERQFGVDVDLGAWAKLPLRALLFGEGQARVVISTPSPDAVLAAARTHGVPARVIGTVRPADDGITMRIGARVLRAPASRLAHAYHDSIAERMRTPAGASAAP
jgi:phosphoribosylformylglycinamidine synthase